jgi:hypothetical protein
MPRQALRLAAVVRRGRRVGRHDVDVGVPAVLGAERDPLAVGRELRVLGFALEARETPRRTAGAVDDPDVVGVRERDVLFADGGAAQHPGLRGGWCGRYSREYKSKTKVAHEAGAVRGAREVARARL